MDSSGVGRGAVEELNGEGKGEVGIFDAKGSGWDVGEAWASTTMAVALVVRARAAYLGLETKVRSPGPAVSMPATRVISAEGSPRRVGIEVLGQFG